MPEDEGAAPQLPAERKRKSHKKSRNGCLSCKQRHIRCDERRPACAYCLVRGFECIYVDPVIWRETAPSRIAVEVVGPKPGTLLSATPSDPFDALPGSMTNRSQELVHHFVQFRQNLRRIIGKNPITQMFQDTIMNPGTLDNIMLEAAHHYISLYPRDPNLVKLLTHHKYQLIRSVKERIASATSGRGTWPCIDGIGDLFFLDCYFDNQESALVHLRGLFAFAAQEKRVGSDLMYGYAGLRITLIVLSFLEAAKKRPEDFRPPGPGPSLLTLLGVNPVNWLNAVYRMGHLYGEFIVDPDIHHVETRPNGLLDSIVLHWLRKAVWNGAAEGTMQTTHEKSVAWLEKTWQVDKRQWLAATAGYALCMATVSPLDDPDAPGPRDYPDDGLGGRSDREDPRTMLRELQRWYDKSLQSWMATGTLPSWDLMQDVLDRVAWMTSGDGQRVVEYVLQSAIARKKLAMSQDLIQSSRAVEWALL